MKTQDILLLAGLGIGAYFLLRGSGSQAQPDQSGGGGGGGFPMLENAPEAGPGSKTSTEGLFTQQPKQETLFYAGQGYSVRESNVQAMVNQLARASSPVAPVAYAQPSAVQAARTYYSGGPAPSYVGSGTPSDLNTGMSVRQDQPFIPSVTQKPVGFK